MWHVCVLKNRNWFKISVFYNTMWCFYSKFVFITTCKHWQFPCTNIEFTCCKQIVKQKVVSSCFLTSLMHYTFTLCIATGGGGHHIINVWPFNSMYIHSRSLKFMFPIKLCILVDRFTSPIIRCTVHVFACHFVQIK